MLLNLLFFLIKTIILGFAAFGMYFFYKILQIAYLQVKIQSAHQKQSPEEMKAILEAYAKRHNRNKK